MELKAYWVLVAGFVVILLYTAIVVARRPRVAGWEGFSNANTEFIMFGVPWCPHCTAAKPKFEKLGSTATIGEHDVSFRYVNPEEDKDAATGFDIEGYPSFFLVKDGQKIKYDGPREEEGILQFLQENLGA